MRSTPKTGLACGYFKSGACAGRVIPLPVMRPVTRCYPRPRSYLGQRFTFVITLCDRRQERTCPIFPGAIWRHEWHLENPALADSPEEHGHRVRRVRDQLREHVVLSEKNGVRSVSQSRTIRLPPSHWHRRIFLLDLLVWSQLLPEPAGHRQFSLIRSRRLPDHEFRDLNVLIDLTDQKLHLAFVKDRC
jgi:hypothetical protein